MATFAGERLFAYKMTNDSGFAPNPFHGFCTLATCKPQIRLKKREGDWIAGFTSRRLNGDDQGDERLVYLMRVDEKLGLEEYFADSRFSRKKPVTSATQVVDLVGDNIYWREGGRWHQLPNVNHTPKELAHDTGGRCVLVSRTFAYFGSEPLEIPKDLRPNVPTGISAHGARTHDPGRASRFIDFVIARKPRRPRPPTRWPKADSSWRSSSACA